MKNRIRPLTGGMRVKTNQQMTKIRIAKVAFAPYYPNPNTELYDNQQHRIIMLVIYRSLSYLQYLHCG